MIRLWLIACIVAGLVCSGGDAWAQDSTTTGSTTDLSAGSSESVSTAEPDLQARGVDLAAQPWYVADLPPDALPVRIAAQGTLTSAVVQLKVPSPHDHATLFNILELNGAPESCALLTIGDLNGCDSTYINGQLIGQTSGWGVTDTGLRRVYTIPRELLREGTNVLAIRMSGTSGRTTFGIRKPPLTFAFLPPGVTQVDGKRVPNGAPPADSWNEKAVLEAIKLADPDTSLGAVMRKRGSVGRFGVLLDDGLPTVAEVGPVRVSQRGGPSVEVVLDSVSTATVASPADIGWWGKRVSVGGVSSGADVEYAATSAVLYPGMLFEPRGTTPLLLRLSFPSRDGTVLALTDADVGEAMGAGGDLPTVVLGLEKKSRAVPVMLVAVGASANVSQAADHADITFAPQPGQNAQIMVVYPMGLGGFDSRRGGQGLNVLSGVTTATKPAVTLRHWLRLALWYPRATDEWFAVLPETPEAYVRIYQTVRYDPRPARWAQALGGPLVPRPAQVDWAKQEIQYGIRVPETYDTGLLSFTGPVYASQVAAPTTSASVVVGVYDLPVPPMHERILPRVNGASKDAVDYLNSACGDFGTSQSQTAMDMLWKGRTQAYQVWPYLTAESKARVETGEIDAIAAALRPATPWTSATEPLSGRTYWKTYFIEGAYFAQYDQDWGSGLALAGLAAWTKHRGEIATVAGQWPAVERMVSWLTTFDDWEWMRASNSEVGHGTGAGDCMNATYAGSVAYARLAALAGRTSDARYGTYMAARAAVPVLTRFTYDDFGRRNGFYGADSTAVGFHEGQGFLLGELKGYTWNVTSNISGNGLQPGNFDLYEASAIEVLRSYERRFARAYANWYDGRFAYGRPTLYRDNSPYITMPHLYLRARFEMDSRDELLRLLQKARPNTYLRWVAPPAVAEILNRDVHQVAVLDWGRAAFVDAALNQERDDNGKLRRMLEATIDVKTVPEELLIALPDPPREIMVNGSPLPLIDKKFADEKLKVRLRRTGRNVVTVKF